MLRAFRFFSPIFLFVDVSLAVAALEIGDWLRKTLPYGMKMAEGTANWLSGPVYGVAAVAWLLAFFFAGSHQAQRLARRTAWRRLLLGHVVGLLLFVAGLFFLKIGDFSRLLLGYVAASGLVLFAVRSILTGVVFRRALRPFASRVLLVGGGEVAEEVARRLNTIPFGMSLVGVVATGERLEEYAQLGTLDAICELVGQHQIDDVILALPAEQHASAEQIIMRLQATPVRIHFVPDVLALTVIRATVTDLFGIPVVGLREPPIDEVGRLAKRAFDLLAGSIATLLAAPLMLGAAAAIKLHDGGPVFFRQRRIGENGKPFDMLKFRSMVVDAESRLKSLGIDLAKLPKDDPVFKIQNDPRVTPIGRFLRRWSVDELPQLLNVLKGEMSLVGPRPEEAKVVASYSFFHRKRLAVKPGITGPMQVSGRGDLPLKQRLKLELAYIDTWSLWSDLKILAKTLPVVLWGKGAY